jgi:TRAP-type C4-dicarboxylate transport system permease large subunit
MPVFEIFKHALPYITINIIVLVLISTIPALTTWLPTLLGYSLN